MLNICSRPWFAVLFAALGAAAAPDPAPAHVVAFWEKLVGTWIADNRQHKSDTEPMDAYGIEWKWGLNRKSIVGRLYGIRDGKDIGTFWEFREFWHPGERRVVSMQFGTEGTYGVGPHEIESDGSSEMLQVFYDPTRDTTAKIGHRAHLKGDAHTTTSFDVDEKGVWTQRRTYVWRREAQDHERAAEHFNPCRARGIQGANTGFLICAAAERRGFPILATDDDFARVWEALPIAPHGR